MKLVPLREKPAGYDGTSAGRILIIWLVMIALLFYIASRVM